MSRTVYLLRHAKSSWEHAALADIQAPLGPRAKLASLLVFSWIPAPWLVIAFVIGFGSAMGARGPIVSSLAARHFGGSGFATIYGTMFAWMSTSGAAAAFIAGWLYDLTGGYRAGLLFSMVTVLIAVSPFWSSRPLSARRG